MMEQPAETKEAVNQSSSVASGGDTVEGHAHGTRLIALTASLMLGMFLVALGNARLQQLLSFRWS
jgi:MFS superfamily sulfate permease-like transporter